MNLREELASLCHARWAGWMTYLFNRCYRPVDMPTGSLVIPEDLVLRWQRQAATKYCDLPEGEKESDRGRADKFLALLDRYMAEQLEQDLADVLEERAEDLES